MKSYHSRPFLSFNSPATLFSQSESIKSYPDAVKNICHLFLEISFSLIFLVKSCLEEPINIKKIIFLVIFLSFDIIFAILWKVLLQSRLFQYVLFFKQISFVVTSYLLLYEKLSKSQSFFLGFYLLYLNSANFCAHENNQILLLIKFSITILCFSFEGLNINDNLIILLMNLSLCLIMGVSTWKAFPLDNKTKTNSSIFPGFIFNNIYPGANIILKKTTQQRRGNLFKHNQASPLILEFANFCAQNDYDFNNFEDLSKFCQELKEIQKINKEKIEVSEPKITLILEELNPLLDLFKVFNENNYFQMKDPRVFFAFYPKKQIHLRIYVGYFIYYQEKYLYLNIEKSHTFQEIKSLREISNRKDQLLASVSHDLRSPLSGIITFVNHAKLAEDSLERNKYLDFSRINADLLMSLINDLLDYSAINKGNINLNISDISLNQIIKEVYELMRIQADMKGLFLRVSNDFQDEDLTMQSDCRRIKQILINLLNNSIKFALKGGIELKVLKTKHKNIIKFEVVDSGVGIKPEIVDSLGIEYATFDTEKGLNKYGIGLGLNICKKLIKLLGPYDDLYISSIYGKGTKIGFLLYDKIQEQATLSLKTILTYSPRKKKYFCEKMKSSRQLETDPNVFPNLKRMSSDNPVNILELPNGNQMKKNEHDGIKDEDLSIIKKISSGFSIKIPIENSNSYNKKVSLSDFNLKMGTRRSFLKGESTNFHNIDIETKSKKADFSPCSNKLRREEAANLFSPFESFDFDLEESNYFNEGDLKINLKFFDELREFHCQKKKSRIKLLLADDNPFNLLILQSFFIKLKNLYDLQIDTAANGLVSIERFIENNGVESNDPYQFIFMDCIMPIKDGYTASIEIKKLIKNGDFYDVIIIAVTGMCGVEEEKKCLMFGMDDFLTKPVQEQELMDILNFYIQKFEIK